LESVQNVNVEGHNIHVACSRDVTPLIVRFFVEKGYDVMGVQKKVYGLDDIYQKYFENNLTENAGNEKSSSLF
jgi:ABC-2 type transport system ATP-binding protein